MPFDPLCSMHQMGWNVQNIVKFHLFICQPATHIEKPSSRKWKANAYCIQLACIIDRNLQNTFLSCLFLSLPERSLLLQQQSQFYYLRLLELTEHCTFCPFYHIANELPSCESKSRGSLAFIRVFSLPSWVTWALAKAPKNRSGFLSFIYV